jgi:serine phosphatase RsbU (regulator of sigma subunit)
MATTKTFKVSGIVSAAAVLLLFAGKDDGGVQGLGVFLAMCAWPVFLVSATRHAFRRMLWRVGSRLLVSYLLIGIVPLPFLAGLAYLASYVISGQLAGRRVKNELIKREDALRLVAEDLADDVPAAPAARRERLASAAEEARAHWAFAPAGGGAPEGDGPLSAADLTKEPPESAAVGRLGGTSFLVRVVKAKPGTAVLYVPFDTALASELRKETGVGVIFTGTRVEKSDVSRLGHRGVVLQGSKDEDLEVDTDPIHQAVAEKGKAPEPKGPLQGRWVAWLVIVEHPVYDWSTGQLEKTSRSTAIVRSSVAREFDALFVGARLGSGRVETGRIVLTLMKGVALFTLCVYFVAGTLAAFLVMRIARATSRLSTAVREVGEGNFGARAELKGRDQLAELVAGFNRMSAHLETAMSARAEQEALKRELEVAQRLQLRLLPPADFAFPGVELAADFRPAAEVGGDFYHLAAQSGDRLVVAVADVSGHGLPTGIVMAAANASLSALLGAGAPVPEIFATLDRELRATTDPRTFVTLTLARFRLKDRAVDVTNAGHVYPYRVTSAGVVSSVELPSRPLGLPGRAPAAFASATAPAEPGDLWVFLSDGVVEASGADDTPFGFARLEALLAECGGLQAREASERVLAAWKNHTGRDEPDDDRTLLVVRILPG